MKALLALLLALFLVLPCYAARPPVEVDGRAAIASGATTVHLDGVSGYTAYHHVIIWLDASSSTMYLTLNSGATAASTNPLLPSGQPPIRFDFDHSPVNDINYYGNGTTGDINWMAW